MLGKIRRTFLDSFKTEPLLFRAPGRINIIGEHTDYNHGLVLPAAIDQYIYVGITLRSDQEIRMVSVNYQDTYFTHTRPLQASNKAWPNYILGILDQFEQMGIQVPGLNIVLGGDIPQGAGMSSSAAVECAMATALNTLLQLDLPPLSLAKMAQKAEQEFAGVQCGLMDQFASIFGKQQHIMLLDCNDLSYKYLPFNTTAYTLVLLDSHVKHALASSAYNDRRACCERGVNTLKEIYPQIKSLRDVSPEMLTGIREKDPEAYKRCGYVLRENERVIAACKAIDDKDFHHLGKLLFQGHLGLKEVYEVSCREIDVLVDLAREQAGVLGARMMGGGFGGCTLNLVERNVLPDFILYMEKNYQQATGKTLSVYPVHISGGAEQVVSSN